jgi:1D-myo-inositol-tetrakisphosphate 5-kinase/inositol-polyphosphate multikinase
MEFNLEKIKVSLWHLSYHYNPILNFLHSTDYLVMEDLTASYQKPSILDIKMGTTSVGEDASPEKKAAMRAKDESTTTVSIGIRVSGFKVQFIKNSTS